MCKYISFALSFARSFSLQKRRSGRQVKRRKYNEDLDFKVVDDDGETIGVLGSGRIAAMSSSTLAWQAEVTVATSAVMPHHRPALLLEGRSKTHWNNSHLLSFQEPHEDEANIIEKILTVRTVKKEVTVSYCMLHL